MKKMIFIVCIWLLLLGVFAFAKGGQETEKSGKEAATASVKQEPVNLVFWWWGEQEAPGLEAWLKETVDLFQKANPGITVETVLQATDNVVDDFMTASAAGTPPDLQYLWNGIYHQENVWRGYLEPLENLIPKEQLSKMYATDLSFYQGKQYRAGWYLLPFGMMYNKKIFKEAGVPAEMMPPKTFDDFMKASEIIKNKGIIPMSAGFKDGFWGEQYTGHGLVQNEDDVSDTTRLVLGEYKWTDPRWHEHWTRLEQYIKAGYINADANSLEFYQGIELFNTGKAAMTLAVLSLVPPAEKALGLENVGIMTWPVWGKGKLAGLPIIEVQGLGISSKSKHKKEAARFIMFMHTSERLTAMYKTANVFPADLNWDGAKYIQDPNSKEQWEWFTGKNTAYICGMICWDFDSEVMYPAPQMLISGTKNAEEIAVMAEEVMARWREENPDLVESHIKWTEK